MDAKAGLKKYLGSIVNLRVFLDTFRCLFLFFLLKSSEGDSAKYSTSLFSLFPPNDSVFVQNWQLRKVVQKSTESNFHMLLIIVFLSVN